MRRTVLTPLSRRRQVVLWLIIAAAAAGCDGIGMGGAGTDPTEGTETVALTVDHRSEWRVLWIEGETDLPNGAYVNYRVTHDLARSTSPDAWPAQNLDEAGRSAVQDGQFWTRINTLNWPAGNVTVLVQFPLPPQPAEVVARYGEFGEHLTGEHVAIRQGMKAVEVQHTFEHRP